MFAGFFKFAGAVVTAPGRWLRAKSVNDMNDEAQCYARMCRESYEPWRTRGDVGGYTLDPDLNEEAWCAFVNNDEVVVAFRGSSSTTDWLVHDVFIALLDDPITAVPAACRFVQRVVNKHPNKKLCVTGHSLGGSIAHKVSPAPEYGHIFNPGGAGLFEACSVFNQKIFAHHIMGDPVSMSWTNTPMDRYNTRSLEKHGLGNFITSKVIKSAQVQQQSQTKWAARYKPAPSAPAAPGADIHQYWCPPEQVQYYDKMQTYQSVGAPASGTSPIQQTYVQSYGGAPVTCGGQPQQSTSSVVYTRY